jgi:hypothetical protein
MSWLCKSRRHRLVRRNGRFPVSIPRHELLFPGAYTFTRLGSFVDNKFCTQVRRQFHAHFEMVLVSSDGKTCCWSVMFIPTEQEMELIGSNAMSNTRYMNWHGNLEKHEHRNLNRVQLHQVCVHFINWVWHFLLRCKTCWRNQLQWLYYVHWCVLCTCLPRELAYHWMNVSC